MADDTEIALERRLWKLEQDNETLKARLSIAEIANSENKEFMSNIKGVVLLFKFLGLLAGAGSVLAFFVDFVSKKGG
jgi:hypothetical protein